MNMINSDAREMIQVMRGNGRMMQYRFGISSYYIARVKKNFNLKSKIIETT
jgi:hypothetical protein